MGMMVLSCQTAFGGGDSDPETQLCMKSALELRAEKIKALRVQIEAAKIKAKLEIEVAEEEFRAEMQKIQEDVSSADIAHKALQEKRAAAKKAASDEYSQRLMESPRHDEATAEYEAKLKRIQEDPSLADRSDDIDRSTGPAAAQAAIQRKLERVAAANASVLALHQELRRIMTSS